MAPEAVASSQASSARQLASVIKSARDIMRKDKGLSGDLDRLPMLTWIMFLKFLDDMEQLREAEAALEGRQFRPAIEPPYRWRDWAANPGGVTGDELIAFINQDEAVRTDGTRGAGLFAYLRSLRGTDGGDRRDVIANVFRDTINRMINGYLLRDVINKLHAINFRSSDEIHTLGTLYESMLKEMRDAAGDSGEFYTPRPVVQFIATVVNPQLGETVLDPAAGTGGFLVSAFEHLQKQCGKVEDHERLQRSTLFGIEAKPLPYLLCQMNLLLHDLEYPEIDYGNALRFPLREIGDKDRVDIVMTNPPFGGGEERGILGNFPEDRQTTETALLFLQLIMRRLRRPSGGRTHGGRAAVVVPNGTLYDKGIAAKIREDLVERFHLEAVLRLPKGVFEPYTDIATNILFFCTGSPADGVWIYELPLPSRRAHLKSRSFSATDGIQLQDLIPVLQWWSDKKENDVAWYVPVESLRTTGYDLALSHPQHAVVDLPSPTSILSTASDAAAQARESLRALYTITDSLVERKASPFPLGQVLRQRDLRIRVSGGTTYTRPRVQLHFRGAVVRDCIDGAQIGTKMQTVMCEDDLIVSRIDARNGAMAIVPRDLDGAIATNDFPIFEIDQFRVLPRYLRYTLFQPQMLRIYETLSRGSTNRRRLHVGALLNLEIPLPNLDDQVEITEQLEACERAVLVAREGLTRASETLGDLLAATIHSTFSRSED